LSDRYDDLPSHSNQRRAVRVFFFFGWRVGGGVFPSGLSANQQLQAVLVVGLLRGAGGQKGCGDGGPGRRGDVEEGVRADAGGRRVAERGGRRDAGEVDAEREPRLLQGFLRHGEGLELLLAVRHVGVLASSTDAIQTCLGEEEETSHGTLVCFNVT